MTIQDLPTLNASLNGLSAVFLLFGYFFIKRGDKKAHRNCMISAVVTSTIFLACYLTYHELLRRTTGSHGTPFAGQGAIRYLYFTILISHIILAVVIVPMVITTVVYAIRQRWESHKRLSRVTWPLWMYVSVTGVIVYLMLYHWFPAR
jgi:uncharacterized membrane protein YozB (DUF420 family)